MPWTKSALFAAVLIGGAAAPLAASAADVKRVDVAAGPAAPAFQQVSDGDRVALDLTFALGEDLAGAAATLGLEPGECPFGPLASPIDPISAPTGDNHLLVSLTLGDPEQHAANLASCEYRVGADGPEAALRLRGCFLALEIAMPTARYLTLRPLPAERCEPRP